LLSVPYTVPESARSAEKAEAERAKTAAPRRAPQRRNDFINTPGLREREASSFETRRWRSSGRTEMTRHRSAKTDCGRETWISRYFKRRMSGNRRARDAGFAQDPSDGKNSRPGRAGWGGLEHPKGLAGSPVPLSRCCLSDALSLPKCDSLASIQPSATQPANRIEGRRVRREAPSIVFPSCLCPVSAPILKEP